MPIARFLAFVLALSGQAPKDDPAASTDRPRAETPEATLRAFMDAMIARDEPRLRDLALPDDDLHYLLKTATKPNLLQVTVARRKIAQVPIRALTAGEIVEIPTPGGKKLLVVGPDEVSDTAAFLLMEGNPVPTRIRKVDGRWKVDARPMIAGRKAAEAARKRPDDQPKP
ncbi:hypothetical protein TA3x_002636 [Tundrisphaera sp. TA3]|uniref:hypothetical protein n=1 Tax=Tundrisphaera sp. TA3 TaxID=3435775 RepID=UPI003EC0EBFC